MMQATSFKNFALLCLSSALVACGAPLYKQAPDEVMVPVRNLGLGVLSFCKDGKFYSADFDSKTGEMLMPAGQRITVSSYMSYSGGNMNYSCKPKLSFIPREGQAYFVNTGYRYGMCFIELVRRYDDKETGVMLEHSLEGPHC